MSKMNLRILITVIGLGLTLMGCRLLPDSRAGLNDTPAPTTIPLTNTASPATVTSLTPPEEPITLPPGFQINVFAQGLDGPRMLTVGPDGFLYVAERGAGRILRLPDRNGDGQVDEVEVVADKLESPSSLAFFKDGSLYVGLTTQVLRLSDLDSAAKFQTREVIIAGLPAGGHGTRTVLFSPDWASLFVSIGSSCNVCVESDPRRAAIVRYNPDGSGEEIYASGLRNAVGITFRPGTNELWATNNGRDWLGDNLPPENIYQVQEGIDYGWPRCHSGRIVDPEFGQSDACEDVGQPAVETQAHSAPLGLVFYDGDQFPPEYRDDLFVAFHGSWNRSTPTGYKVVRIPMDGDLPGEVQDFATGWLRDNGSGWGRPVGLAVGADGGLYISDDDGGNIYRIVVSE